MSARKYRVIPLEGEGGAGGDVLEEAESALAEGLQCEQDLLSAAEDAVAEVDEAGEGAGVGERGSAAAGSTYVRTSTC